jgi:NTP pyrophosphatase (non-canonical NTP hydrolase)
MHHIDEKVKETLVILQEECAEVTQAVSKIIRFGFEELTPLKDTETNKIRLEKEIGDLLTMVDILVEQGVLSDSIINKAKIEKRNKLHIWSDIFK